MINGLHTLIYSDDPGATRTFLRDVLEWSSIDAGDGWLIFKTPPAEMGVHPTEGDGETWATTPHHQVSLMCDDIEATVADLRERGVEVAGEIKDEGFGLTTMVTVPGAGEMMLYQARHELAHALDD